MTNRNLSRQDGFSLIEVVIAMAVGAIVALGMATMMTNSFRAQKGASDYTDFNSDIMGIQMAASAAQSNCANMLYQSAGHPFALNLISTTQVAPASTTIPLLTLGSAPGAPVLINSTGATDPDGWTNQLSILNGAVTLAALNPGVSATFTMQLVLTRTNTKTGIGSNVLSNANNPIPFSITTKDDGPNHGGTIQGCGNAPTPVAVCPSGFTMVGAPGLVESFCISTNPEGPTDGLTATNECATDSASLTAKPGQAAHLCTHSEWTQACWSTAALGLSGIGTPEWVSDTLDMYDGSHWKAYQMDMGPGAYYGGTCAAFGYDTPPDGSDHNFRCCFSN